MQNTVSLLIFMHLLISPALVLDKDYSFVYILVYKTMFILVLGIKNLSASRSTFHFCSELVIAQCFEGLFLPQLHLLGWLEQGRPQNWDGLHGWHKPESPGQVWFGPPQRFNLRPSDVSAVLGGFWYGSSSPRNIYKCNNVTAVWGENNSLFNSLKSQAPLNNWFSWSFSVNDGVWCFWCRYT